MKLVLEILKKRKQCGREVLWIWPIHKQGLRPTACFCHDWGPSTNNDWQEQCWSHCGSLITDKHTPDRASEQCTSLSQNVFAHTFWRRPRVVHHCLFVFAHIVIYIYTLGNSRHGIWFYRENAEKAEVYKVGGEPLYKVVLQPPPGCLYKVVG